MAQRFTYDQQQQIIEWFAEGKSAKSIVAATKLQNEMEDGCYPWPPSITVDSLDSIREETRALVAKAIAGRLDTALNRGLGKRENQATFLVEHLEEQDSITKALASKFNKLLGAGALDLDIRDVMPAPEPDDEIIEGEVVGRIKNPPDVISDSRNAPLSPDQIDVWLKVKDEMFKRAMSIGKLYTLMQQTQAKHMEVLGRVAATIDLPQRIDLAVQQKKLDEIMEMLTKKAKKEGVDFHEVVEEENELPD